MEMDYWHEYFHEREVLHWLLLCNVPNDEMKIIVIKIFQHLLGIWDKRKMQKKLINLRKVILFDNKIEHLTITRRDLEFFNVFSCWRLPSRSLLLVRGRVERNPKWFHETMENFELLMSVGQKYNTNNLNKNFPNVIVYN